MLEQMRALINDVFYDLEDVCSSSGQTLNAELLADVLGDRMYDISEEYRRLDCTVGRALCLQVASEYL